MSTAKVRTAVIPAAGLGTRLLPATKVVPKEMLPIGDRPLIQYAVEEAAASGLERVILVIGEGKTLLPQYFQRDVELEKILLQRGRKAEAEVIRSLSEMAEICTVWQEVPLGLADAIRCASSLVGQEPFAVILPDAVIDSAVPCTRQLIDCYERHPGCIIATGQVEPSEVERFGILELDPVADSCCNGRVAQVRGLIERPRPGTVSSRYGIFGRYILEPEIFDSIEQTSPGFGGELQLTDSLRLCAAKVPVYAYEFEGKHYDAGSKLGFLQTALAFALKDPELAGPLREHLLSLELQESAKPA